ncbi:CBL-interacting serine/threonine-protein kinase 23 [Diplonema papillatum]|nr:CBL-interacting serine/threonine-protein kinase 23 [Diplonema papillatum]|eukprot:gene16514-25321_t
MGPPHKKKGMPASINGRGVRYRIGDTLGKGAFGIVKLATNEQTGEKFAAKVIDLGIVMRDGLMEYVDRETRLVTKLQHPHIIRMVEVIELQDYHLRFYIMELAPNGELFDQIVAVHRFAENTARRYYQQLISAVRYCHHEGVVHRDLKAENLLLAKDSTLKVCDFGLSRYTGEEAYSDSPQMFTSIAGSLDYQAPEIVRNQKYHGKPADIWSCGVILGFMLSGWLPFQDHGGDAATKKRITARPPSYTLHDEVSEKARDLISRCLQEDPTKRITADEIIRHPWFSVGLDAAACTRLKIPLRLILEEAGPASPLPSHHGSPPHGNGHGRGENGSLVYEDTSDHEFPEIDRQLLRQLRLAFDSIDTDRSGIIKEEELRDILIKLNNLAGRQWLPTREEVRTLLHFFEPADNEKGITFAEFVAGYVENKVEGSPLGQRLLLKDLVSTLSTLGPIDFSTFDLEYVEKLRTAFNQIDEDKSGVIHNDELKHLFERAGIEVTESELSKLFEYMDVGKQDFITFDEFANAWTCRDEERHEKRGVSNVMARIRKCHELLDLAEADEARKVLFQSNFAKVIKCDTRQAIKVVEDALRSVREFNFRIEKEDVGNPFQGSLRVAAEEGSTTVCELAILVTPSATGYSSLLIRRITGGTVYFHQVFNAYMHMLEKLPVYTEALEDLADDGAPVEL